MKLRLIDIGGSGVKTIKIDHSKPCIIKDHEISFFPHPNWDDFTLWLFEKKLLDTDFIGISCAGFIRSDDSVKLFRVGNWYNKPLVSEIKQYRPNAIVYLINDAEAHLMAHYDIVKNPFMNICLGTSIGFSIADINGTILRPLDGLNYDIGELSIPTRASNKQVWWSLGSHGLDELQKTLGHELGTKHFGNRIGFFLSNICSVFRPTTIVFSGGITENCWNLFKDNLMGEFNHSAPDCLEKPEIIKSPFSKNAGLVGIGKYVLKSIL